MFKNNVAFFTSILLLFFVGCGGPKEKKDTAPIKVVTKTDSMATKKKENIADEPFVLTDENAIEFFFDYNKTLKKNKVKLTTSMGDIFIELYENVPYHRANFIYLTRQGYFDGTMFHRVVKNFIIQGGSSDDPKIGKRRTKIGRYLLPPDGNKGHRHDRGVISMPSSERDNPHKLASPYEFFIVVTKPGAYHLDGDYTPFGKVYKGLDVVDKINNVPVDKGDWPKQNVFILKAEVL